MHGLACFFECKKRDIHTGRGQVIGETFPPRSGLDSNELVHRVWRQLVFCLTNVPEEQVSIKLSFVKVSAGGSVRGVDRCSFQAIIETLGNDSGESNHAAIECCLFVGQHSKELDYKYEALVSETADCFSMEIHRCVGRVITHCAGETQGARTVVDHGSDEVLDDRSCARQHQ